MEHDDFRRAVALALRGLAVCAVLLCAVATGWMGFGLAASDYANIRGVEPAFVLTIQRLAAGLPLYSSPDDFPFMMGQYAPLYFYVCRAGATIAGIAPDDVHGVTALARTVSTVASILTALVACLIMRRALKIGWAVAVVAAGALFVCLAPWSLLARPDALCTLLLLSSFGCAVASLSSHKGLPRDTLLLCLAGFLGVLAGFTKQNGFQGPMILVSFLFFAREWRRFALALASTAIPVVLASGLLYCKYGAALYQNVVGGLLYSGTDLLSAFEYAFSPAFLHMNYGLLVALAAIAALAWLNKGASRHEQFIAYAGLCLLALATFSSTKFGSAHNYYNDFLAFATISAAYLLVKRYGLGRPEQYELTTAAAVFLLVFIPHLTLYNALHYQTSDDIMADRAPIREVLAEKLAAHPEAILLSRDMTLAAQFAGRTVLLRPVRAPIEGEPTPEPHFAGLKQWIDDGRARYYVAREYHRPHVVLGRLGVESHDFQLLTREHGFEIWVNSKEELLRNGSFEVWEDGAPAGWQSRPGPAGQVPGESPGGNALAMPEGDWAAVSQALEPLPDTPEATLLVRADVRASLSGQFILKLLVHGAEGDRAFSETQNKTGEWQRLAFTCPLSSIEGIRGAAIQLLRCPGKSGSLEVDNVSVTVEP